MSLDIQKKIYTHILGNTRFNDYNGYFSVKKIYAYIYIYNVTVAVVRSSILMNVTLFSTPTDPNFNRVH